MTTAEITVERMRVKAAAPGLRARVEDALRVSSKPPALLNRYVLVRRLRLRAAAGASAQSLALQLERAWQALAAQARPMETAGDSAEAVWAPSVRAARQMLLRRWLRGEAAQAWFWERVAPGAVLAEAVAWPLRAVGLMLAPPLEDSLGDAAVEMRKQVAQLRGLLSVIAEHGALLEFVDGVSEADALALLTAIERCLEGERPRRVWQGMPHVQVRTFSSQAHARLFEAINVLMPGVLVASVERRDVPDHPEAPAAMQPLARSLVAPASAGSPATAVSAMPPFRTPVLGEPASMCSGLGSPWSGLWLMLPILLRHGLDDADDPLAAWSGAMRAAFSRFRIPEDDPIRTALDLSRADPSWLRVARLAAVHDARLPLLRIARRRGAAWVSPERIDVEFPTDALDLRIRRAGFDIDPGFLPWLGRIVHFHYP